MKKVNVIKHKLNNPYTDILYIDEKKEDFVKLSCEYVLVQNDILKFGSVLMRFNEKKNIFERVFKNEHSPIETNDVQMIYRASVIVLSDSGSRGEFQDTSGVYIQQALGKNGFFIEKYIIIPDEENELLKNYNELTENNVNLVITTGGTGLYLRDITPETTKTYSDREVPGISHAMIDFSLKKTPMAMLGRIFAGTKGRMLIINLPGSLKAVKDCMEVISPKNNKVLFHACEKLTGFKDKCGE